MNRTFTEPTPLVTDVVLLATLALLLWGIIGGIVHVSPLLFAVFYCILAFTILKIRNNRKEFVAISEGSLTAKGHSSEYTYTTMKQISISFSELTFWSGELNEMPSQLKIRYLPNRRWSAKKFLWIQEKGTNDWLMLRRIGFHQSYDELIALLNTSQETKDTTSRTEQCR